MLHDRPAPDSNLNLLYLSKFLQDNDLVVLPKTLAYLYAYWSTLDVPDKANLLCALKRLSINRGQNKDRFVVSQQALQHILVNLEFMDRLTAESEHLLSKNLAALGHWNSAWEIAKLDPDLKKSVTHNNWVMWMESLLEHQALVTANTYKP